MLIDCGPSAVDGRQMWVSRWTALNGAIPTWIDTTVANLRDLYFYVKLRSHLFLSLNNFLAC
jgi:hypothetical protein